MAMSKGLALAVGAWAVGFSSVAWALPVLDAKDAAVRIATPDATTMNITSTSTIENSNHVIKWVDFSIAGGETVTFDNRNYLNYVTGHAASEIFGTLTGGGKIFVVNPNGILIGDGATVNVGSLYLSTKQLDPATLTSYDAGISALSSATIGSGDVINMGTLNATSISVEGNVIKFKNVAEVEAESINVAAKKETRVGYVAGETDPAAYGNLASAQWYKLVRNENELQNMGLTGNYMLARDMEVNGEFTAIGGASEKFKGHFDGLGHKVEFTELAEVKANGSKLGLFGEIFEGATVENVGVITSNLDFLTAGNDTIYVGGVVGYNNKGTIRNVWHSGDIHVTKSCMKQYVGGIVGYNDSGTVISAYNIGKVFASRATAWARVGGIAGHQQLSTGKTALIKDVCNTGTVQALGNDFVGGIAGTNTGGNIRNVYNLGSVSSGSTAGGIVGQNNRTSAPNGVVSSAYHASGSVNGRWAGAIVGARTNTGTFNHVFFETKDAAGNTLRDAKATTGGKESLKTAQTFLDDGWDISTKGGEGTTWRIYDGQSTPLLTAFLKPKDNIRVMEEDGTQPAGTYGLADAASVMVSSQLQGYEKGYDYVSDVVCIVPKEETTEPEPTDITPTPAITEPSEPTNPTNPSNPTPPTNLPETTQPSVIPNPPDETNIPDRTATEPPVITEPSGTETKEKRYDFDADYKQEMVVLHRPGADKPRVAADENEAKNLVIAGNVVRLPDAIMRMEEVEAMMAEAEAQDSRVAEDETDGSKQS